MRPITAAMLKVPTERRVAPLVGVVEAADEEEEEDEDEAFDELEALEEPLVTVPVVDTGVLEGVEEAAVVETGAPEEVVDPAATEEDPLADEEPEDEPVLDPPSVTAVLRQLESDPVPMVTVADCTRVPVESFKSMLN